MSQYEAGLAASYGHVHILRWFFEWDASREVGDLAWFDAALAGRLDVLRCLVEWGVELPSDDAACLVAADLGHLAALRLLREQGMPIDGELLLSLAENRGHTATADWIREQIPPALHTAQLFSFL